MVAEYTIEANSGSLVVCSVDISLAIAGCLDASDTYWVNRRLLTACLPFRQSLINSAGGCAMHGDPRLSSSCSPPAAAPPPPIINSRRSPIN